MKLSLGNGAFPLLPLTQAISITALLAFDGFDLVLMGNGSHTRPEDIASEMDRWCATTRRRLDDHGLVAADVFCVPWTNFTTMAPNHPDAAERRRGRDLFRQMLDLAEAIGAPGVTMLPGVTWPDEARDVSLARAAEELQHRAVEAGERGLGFSVEPHVGSLCVTPSAVLELLAAAPDLRLTLDYTHFVAQGIAEADIEPLAQAARYVQTRGVAPGELQAPMKRTSMNFERMIDVLVANGYDGWVNVEYVWVAWNRLDEVDIISETVLLRDRLRAKFRGEPWTYPGPTGITEG